MTKDWFPVEQLDSRFRGEGRKIFGPFYQARVLDTETDQYLLLWRGGAPLTGISSVRRAVKYGIDRYKRRHRGL